MTTTTRSPHLSRELAVSSTYFQDGNAAADDNIIADIFHYASCFTSDEGQEDRRLVQVPEQEEFTARCRGTSDMAEQISRRIPKNSLEA